VQTWGGEGGGLSDDAQGSQRRGRQPGQPLKSALRDAAGWLYPLIGITGRPGCWRCS
jgi:hypothetical protein